MYLGIWKTRDFISISHSWNSWEDWRQGKFRKQFFSACTSPFGSCGWGRWGRQIPMIVAWPRGHGRRWWSGSTRGHGRRWRSGSSGRCGRRWRPGHNRRKKVLVGVYKVPSSSIFFPPQIFKLDFFPLLKITWRPRLFLCSRELELELES